MSARIHLKTALSLFIVTALASTAWGQSSNRSVKKKALPASIGGSEVTVPVPQSLLNFSSAPEPIEPKATAHWEIVASSWAPRALSEKAYVNDVGDFQRLKMPMFSLNIWRGDGLGLGPLKLVPKYGLSYSQLTRTATLQLSSSSYPVTQTMNLVSARAGLELTPEADLWGWVRPFISASLLPSLAVTSSSQISEGGSRGLLAFEEVAGLSLQVRPLGSALRVQNIGLEVGLQATQGAGDSSLSGVGVLAGTRIDL